jgi:hypothetical protein
MHSKRDYDFFFLRAVYCGMLCLGRQLFGFHDGFVVLVS